MNDKMKLRAASALVLAALIQPADVSAKSGVSAWASLISGAASAGLGILGKDYFFQEGINIDPATIAAEALVLVAMKKVTDKWDPEPTDHYQMAAKENEDGKSPEVNLTEESEEAKGLYYKVEVLENIGLEALGLKGVADMANSRERVMQGISEIEIDGDHTKCKSDLNEAQVAVICELQDRNYMWLSTAGVARSELGLKTAYQASAEMGGGEVSGEGLSPVSGNEGDEQMVGAGDLPNEFVPLPQLPSKISSTAYGMRVQSVMNLEFAQRINLANVLQGNLLTIEAARVLRNSKSCEETQ